MGEITLNLDDLGQLLTLLDTSIRDMYENFDDLTDAHISNASIAMASIFLKTKEKYKDKKKSIEEFVHGFLKKIKDDYSKLIQEFSNEILDEEINGEPIRKRLFMVVHEYVLMKQLEPYRFYQPSAVKDGFNFSIEEIGKINYFLITKGVTIPTTLSLYQSEIREKLEDFKDKWHLY